MKDVTFTASFAPDEANEITLEKVQQLHDKLMRKKVLTRITLVPEVYQAFIAELDVQRNIKDRFYGIVVECEDAHPIDRPFLAGFLYYSDGSAEPLLRADAQSNKDYNADKS